MTWVLGGERPCMHMSICERLYAYVVAPTMEAYMDIIICAIIITYMVYAYSKLDATLNYKMKKLKVTLVKMLLILS